MKERVSLSLDPKIVKDVDSLIDGINIRSRSDAIEKILKERIVERKTVVILAGGNPEKLLIKETGTYRPLVSIGDRKLIEDIILKCRGVGFVNVIIVGFSSLLSKLYEVLGNGEKYGVKIIYVEEEKELGSAKTLELAKKYIQTDFLFLPCDQYFDFDLKKIHDFHLMNGGIATVGIHTRTSFDWEKGVVEMDGYKIINFEENPKKPKTRLSSVFIGVLKKDVFNYIPVGDVYWSLQENVFPKLATEGNFVGYPIAGNWVNVHTRKDVEKVIKIRNFKTK